MKSYCPRRCLSAAAAAFLLFSLQMPARAFVINTYHVAPGGNDAAAGTNWATALKTIQAAVDMASSVDSVLVSNGVYDTGGRAPYAFGLTNRVMIDKPITVRSVNGPAVTTIRGAWHLGTNVGPTAVRCVWITNNATLSGFTLTNGATFFSSDDSGWGGGVLAQSTLAVISNCVITGNWGFYAGGGSRDGTLYNCTLSGNRSLIGGGSYTSTLINCTLIGNRGGSAGGSYYGTLLNCTVSGNVSEDSGGGALNCTMYNCLITDNVAFNNAGGVGDCMVYGSTISRNLAYSNGGGSSGGVLNNCMISDNVSSNTGGGSAYGVLNNCTLVGNVARLCGGGSFVGTLNNCTISRNTAGVGGGSYVSSLNNCIVYFNTASPDYYENYVNGAVSNTCSTPPAPGAGNFTNDPQFVDAVNSNFLLAAGSPCRDTGNNADAPGATDLDGNTRIVNGYVDIGAYEYQGAGQGDYDGDGLDNGDEGIAGTDFADVDDYFMVSDVSVMSPASIMFDSEIGRVYAVDRNDGLLPNPQVWIEFTNNIVGTGSAIQISDTSESSNRNYRVRVQVAP